jgi:hypothetical protein
MGKHLLLAIPDAKAVNAAAGINSMHSATDARIAMLLSIWPPQKKISAFRSTLLASGRP